MTKHSLLGDLLSHPLIELLRYRDGGPPPDVEPDPRVAGKKLYRGWAVATEHDSKSRSWGVIYASGDSGYSMGAVIGNAVDVAASDERAGAYAGLAPSAAAERRQNDALAAQVAEQALQADLYITEREYLYKAAWLSRGITFATGDEAVAIVALYLRAQGEFMVAENVNYNRGLYYWVGMRELLPSGWRWFSACVHHSSAVNDDAILLLSGSLLQRVDRALRARDAIHVALNQPQNNDLQDDARANLDEVLVLLMGAVDVAARVAHRVLGLPPQEEFGAAWQKTKKGGWLDQVRSKAPKLAAVVDLGTEGAHTLTILRRLRNSVHGAALHGIQLLKSGKAAETLVGLPAEDEAAVLSAMDALGGQAAWGVRPVLPGRTHVDPGIAVDRLFDKVIPLLNTLMDETPVESLSGANVRPGDKHPPAGRGNPFEEWVRQSIRWQLGF